MTLFNIQSTNIEDIPKEFSELVWNNCPLHGHNLLCVEKDCDFGRYLATKGFEFNRGKGTWGWLGVFR